MAQQIPVDPSAIVGVEIPDESAIEIGDDLAYKRLAIVNVVLVGRPGAGEGGWVLVDAGIGGTSALIQAAAAQRFGRGKPAAIVLTHGHFDHVGELYTLADWWDVPVFAHTLEHPFLDGSQAYPPPDATVGGLMARLSPLFPRDPVDVRPWLRALPADGTIPGLPGWRWIHTPGHTPGHISLWREADRALIAGDAFITTAQESAYAALTQAPELHGPPRYFTPDWPAAGASVRHLAALRPEVVITGHGRAMEGPAMRAALDALALNFEAIAVPQHRRA